MSKFNLRPAVKQAPEHKIAFCVGCGLDIPTGSFVKGKYGEYILNGGLASYVGLVAKGNNFKSTICEYLELSAMSAWQDSILDMFDSEVNISRSAHERFINHHCGFVPGTPLFGDGSNEGARWLITDASSMFANEWFSAYKDYANEKIKSKATVTLPILDRSGKEIQIVYPTFHFVDSMSKLKTQDVIEKADQADVGDADNNTTWMNEGRGKKQIMNQVQLHANAASCYFLFTAHIGDNKIEIGDRMPPKKVMQQLGQKERFKGVPDDITYMPLYVWYAYHTEVLMHKESKEVLYPSADRKRFSGDTDLYEVSLNMLRSKVGLTGVKMSLTVSQNEGVHPGLTYYRYLRANKFGMLGNDLTHSCVLMPDVKLSRTTVRDKVDADPKLVRAMHICTELLQLQLLQGHIWNEVLCSPEELYEDIKKLGFDWNEILDTRYKMTQDHYSNPVRYLSTVDLLMMRAGKYTPYWKQDSFKG